MNCIFFRSKFSRYNIFLWPSDFEVLMMWFQHHVVFFCFVFGVWLDVCRFPPIYEHPYLKNIFLDYPVPSLWPGSDGMASKGGGGGFFTSFFFKKLKVWSKDVRWILTFVGGSWPKNGELDRLTIQLLRENAHGNQQVLVSKILLLRNPNLLEMSHACLNKKFWVTLRIANTEK